MNLVIKFRCRRKSDITAWIDSIRWALWKLRNFLKCLKAIGETFKKYVKANSDPGKKIKNIKRLFKGFLKIFEILIKKNN